MSSRYFARTKTIVVSLLLLLLASLATVAAAPTAKLKASPLKISPKATAPKAPKATTTKAAVAKAAAGGSTGFFPLPPCRVFDSRPSSPLPTGVDQVIPITDAAVASSPSVHSIPCGVPAAASAVSFNLTVTEATTGGHILLFPVVFQDGSRPNASTINFGPGQTRANNAVELLGLNGTIRAFPYSVTAGNSVQLILDVNGYFLDAPVASDDIAVTTLNTPLSVAAATGVLANDTLNGAAIASYGAATGAEQTTIGTATPTSAGGSVTLNADGSFNYTPATGFKGDDTFKYVLQNAVGSSTATVTISVGKGNQTISFTSTAPVGAKVGGPTYTATATATSGLPVTFSIDASASSVCTISGSTVSFIGVGTCVIDANQPGDTNWNAAPQVQQSFAVAKGDQTITFTSTAPAGAKVGGPTYTVTATATSGLPVAFTIDATATSVCSISGSTVSFLSVGTCVIDANQAGDANWNAAPQAQQSFAVGKGDQTITFTSTPPAAAAVGGPTYTVTATASSGLPVTFTIDASATSVCSISGSTVSFLAAGTCVIDANQAGNANFNAAPQAQQSFGVGKSAQTITFTSTAPAGAKVGGPTYTVTATASSSLTVALTVDATASTVCSLSGSTVSFLAAGTCVIDANQAGDTNYNPAPQVQQSFTVAKGDQTITFTSTAPVGAKVGGPTYTVTATASSGLAVTFTIDPTASAVCSLSGSTVSFLSPGTCVIDANQAGDANWNAAPQAQQSFAVAKGDQTITFTSTAPVGATVGGATYTVTATASSGLPVTLTIDPTASAVCSISGSTVSFQSVGTCVIDGNQAGNANYNAAPQAQQSFPVGKGNQTITFTSTAPVGATVGGPTYTVTATASSGLPVTFTIDPSASTVCSISGSTVSFIGAGTCVIDANQAGNANYNAAPQAQQSFPVVKGNQTITFTSTAPVGATVGGPTYTVTATASSGLPVTFTIDPTASTVCSISGSTVSFIGAGTCVIDANQAGNASYNAAPQVQQSFPVVKGNQTITFTSTAPAGAAVGGPTYTVTATASSGLTVALTIDPSASSVCSISGSTVSFLSAGTCVIDANQAGNASYNAAPQVQQSFLVNKGNQTITFTSTAPVGATVGGPTYTVTATASSGLPVTFTIDVSATSVCSISGSTVSFIGAGTCVIDANQGGNANYNAAAQAQQSFLVGKGSQTITYTSTAPVGATVGGASYNVTATASSGLAVTFTIDASATSVCSISGSTVSFIGAGTCVIDANQPGNANYNAAPQVQQSFAVVKGNQTISFTSAAPSGAKVGGPTYTVTATATSGLPVTLTIDASATSVCSISGSTVSFIGAGICVIDANQPGNASYNAAPQVQQSFQVNQSPQITSANATSFTSTSPGTFTVTTTGVPSGAAMNISASGALPSGVTFVNNNNGTATLAGTPAAGTQGTYPIVITADNGVAPAATQNFTLTILNTPPTPIASPKENFDTVGNVQLEFKAAPSLPLGFFVSGNLVANFTDPDGPSALSAVAVVAGATTNGGKVDIATNGEFTFTPKAGDLAASDTFQYQVTDGLATVTRTVTINLKSRVWFVKNNAPAGGSGRSHEPFNTLVAAQTASLTGDYIFVYGGDGATTGQAAGITLKANQKLYGEAFGLPIANTINGSANPTLVAANAANRPKIDNTAAGGNAVSITNVGGVEVRGFSIAANTNAINLTTSAAGTGGVTIVNNVITGSGQQGIKIAAGGTGGTTATVQNNAVTSTGNGIDARSTAGALQLAIDNNGGIVSAATGIFVDGSGGGTTTITTFANNVIHQNTLGTGIAITSATFDSVPGGSLQTVSGGTTLIGVSGNGVGGAGMVLAGVSGDLSFTDLDIFADGGAGLAATGTGAFTGNAGFQITVGAGVAMIAAVGGPAVSVSSATISLPFQQITSTNSATTGVSLDTVGGTFSAPSGSSITNASGTDFNVNAGNAAVTYDGTITDTTGRLVAVTNTTGGTKSFTGAISDTGSGTGQGIFLNANSGATINFTGQLTLSTGGTDAFTATGGGTVTATTTTNTVATTTGTALKVQNTVIGAGGLKFKSVSANGGANGIVLDTTGSTGGLTVSGSGSAGSGGTIRNMAGGDGATAGSGIFLNNTSNVSLSWMQLNDFQNFAIRGTSVSGFTLSNSVINGTNGNNASAPFNEGSVSFGGLTGSASISNVSISGGFADNFRVVNTTGVLNRITFSSVTVGANSTANGNDGITLEAQSTATLNATIQNSTFTSARGDLFQLNLLGTSTADLVFTGNTLSNNHPAIATGGGGVTISGGDNSGTGSTLTYNIANNTFRDSNGHAILIVKSTDPGTFSGTFTNNTIGVAGVADSGSFAGSGIKLQNAGLGTVSATITNNQIRQYNNFGIELLTGGGATALSGALNTTITGNTISNPGTGGLPMNGIQLNAGTVPGDTYQICTKIGGAGALANSITGSGANAGTDFRLRQRQSTTVRLPGYGGANNDNTAVVSFIQGMNGGASGLASNTVGSGGAGFVGGGSTCP